MIQSLCDLRIRGANLLNAIPGKNDDASESSAFLPCSLMDDHAHTCPFRPESTALKGSTYEVFGGKTAR